LKGNLKEEAVEIILEIGRTQVLKKRIEEGNQEEVHPTEKAKELKKNLSIREGTEKVQRREGSSQVNEKMKRIYRLEI